MVGIIPVQTSVVAPAFALAGLLADSGFNNYLQSFANASGQTVDFGLGVVRGTGDREAKLPTGATQEFLGVTVRSEMRENSFVNYQSQGTVYQIGEMMTVLAKQGSLWVYTEVDVVAGQAVYCRFLANGGLTTLGAFRNNADTVASAPHAFLVPNAQFDSSGAAGSLVKLLFPK